MIDGRLDPGAGCVVAAVETGCQQKAVDVGKPSKWLGNELLHLFGFHSDNKEELAKVLSRTLMIGDRLDTDIQLAKNVGFASLLVLSGVTNQQEANELHDQHPQKPDIVLERIAHMFVS